jgi:hypothetical protein
MRPGMRMADVRAALRTDHCRHQDVSGFMGNVLARLNLAVSHLTLSTTRASLESSDLKRGCLSECLR